MQGTTFTQHTVAEIDAIVNGWAFEPVCPHERAERFLLEWIADCSDAPTPEELDELAQDINDEAARRERLRRRFSLH